MNCRLLRLETLRLSIALAYISDVDLISTVWLTLVGDSSPGLKMEAQSTMNIPRQN